eukprot:361221-Chlamydomonas_euryale.AAC.7
MSAESPYSQATHAEVARKLLGSSTCGSQGIVPAQGTGTTLLKGVEGGCDPRLNAKTGGFLLLVALAVGYERDDTV